VLPALDLGVLELASRRVGGRLQLADLLLREAHLSGLGRLRGGAAVAVAATDRPCGDRHHDRNRGHAGQPAQGELHALAAGRLGLLRLFARHPLLAAAPFLLLPARHGGEM
jgi:hypothetical protein